VTTTLETRLRAREFVRLKPGDVLSLGVPIQTPVDVRVENSPKFKGRLTGRGDKAAVLVESSTGSDLFAAESA
jgi:flagellar motor switch protein FliM